MDTTSQFNIKMEGDFKTLQDKFSDFVRETDIILGHDSEALTVMDSFVKSVGESVHKLLLAYGTENYIQELSVKDCETQLQEAKHKEVQMRLQFKQIENAINAFHNVAKGVKVSGRKGNTHHDV